MNKPWTKKHQKALIKTLEMYQKNERSKKPISCELCKSCGLLEPGDFANCNKCSWIIRRGHKCYNEHLVVTMSMYLRGVFYSLTYSYTDKVRRKRIRQLKADIKYWEDYHV